MNEQEIFYTIALTRMTGFNSQQALLLYQELNETTVKEEKIIEKDSTNKPLCNLKYQSVFKNCCTSIITANYDPYAKQNIA